MILKSLLALAGPLTVASAALAADAPADSIAPPPADKAQIVFLNPSNAVAAAFPPALFDITETPREFFGKTPAHSNLVALVAPGHHQFMADTVTVTHVMDATVEAGHRYYVLVRFVYGNGFQLRPLRSKGEGSAAEYAVTNPKFADWVKKGEWVTRTPAMDAWYSPGVATKLDEFQAKGVAEWQGKSAEQKAELTLNPEDAVDH